MNLIVILEVKANATITLELWFTWFEVHDKHRLFILEGMTEVRCGCECVCVCGSSDSSSYVRKQINCDNSFLALNQLSYLITVRTHTHTHTHTRPLLQHAYL